MSTFQTYGMRIDKELMFEGVEDFNKQENVVRYMIVPRLADMTNIIQLIAYMTYARWTRIYKEMKKFCLRTKKQTTRKNASGFFIIFIMYQNNIWRGLHEHNHYLDKKYIYDMLFSNIFSSQI
ncbi:hypothetical protein ACJX0J_024646 [Zea mays]